MLASFVSFFYHITGFSQYKVFCLFHVSHTLFWHQLAGVSSRYIKYSKKFEVKIQFWGQFGPKVFLLDPNFTLARNNPRGNTDIVTKHSLAKRIIFFILLN